MDATSTPSDGPAPGRCPTCGGPMSEQQDRVPRGVPDGGQYASSQRGEANVNLNQTDGVGQADGSFRYPPPGFSSAEEVIDFWSSVEIPDEVLARAERVYRELYADVTQAWPTAAWSYEAWEWDPANPRPDAADVGAVADWEGRRRAAQADYEDRMRAILRERPEALDRRDVRPLVRAAAMFRAAAASDLDWAGFERVCNHEVTLTTGRKGVRAAAFETGMSGIASRFLDADQYDLDGVGKDEIRRIVQETVHREMQQTREMVDQGFDDLLEGVKQVGTTVLDAQDPRYGKRH